MNTPSEIASYLAITTKGKKIILFDGVCNLCNSAVQFIIKHDKKDLFRFAAIESDIGQQIVKHIGIDTKKTDTIILYEPGIAYSCKSEAVLEIVKDLDSFYSLLTVFKIFPTAFSDSIYDYVADNRYQWYGKNENCLLPTAELESKFLH